MAFCTSCGASMEGQFCVQCGARAGAEASTPPAAPTPSAYPEPAGPPQKKSKVLIWVLAGCGGLIALTLIGMLAVGFFIKSKVSESGGNPGFAAAKILAAMNPNVDVVRADERTGKITLRDKKTGKTVTLDFQDIQKGRISFEDETGEKVDIRTDSEGGRGSMTMKSSEGTMQWGTGSLADVPGWVPKFPGAQAVGTFSAQGKEGEGGSFQLKCDGSVQKVADFYEQALKGAGMTVEKHTMQADGKSMVMLTGSETTGRSVVANVTSGNEGTVATIIYSTK
jgi:hypothetical protein